MLTDTQADAIVGAIWDHVDVYMPHTRHGHTVQAFNVVAAIVCDATHADITVQPLHDAYARAKKVRCPNP
jgi:hypothetical protein